MRVIVAILTLISIVCFARVVYGCPSPPVLWDPCPLGWHLEDLVCQPTIEIPQDPPVIKCCHDGDCDDCGEE